MHQTVQNCVATADRNDKENESDENYDFQKMQNETQLTADNFSSTLTSTVSTVQIIPSCSHYYVHENTDLLKLSLRKVIPATYRECNSPTEPFSSGSSDEYTSSDKDYDSTPHEIAGSNNVRGNDMPDVPIKGKKRLRKEDS